ncbi:hypothetical protein NDU88_006864 [Pleurodeles waltl]|uniref:Uncharacterized protein n=1 Tax=Pleurodeles waltl TaxID=8319 RepID=A0AAV7WBT1_PLEWA|nr:hypothetical protein NDU88_006864 [Pleurodeles waltl]
MPLWVSLSLPAGDREFRGREGDLRGSRGLLGRLIAVVDASVAASSERGSASQHALLCQERVAGCKPSGSRLLVLPAQVSLSARDREFKRGEGPPWCSRYAELPCSRCRCTSRGVRQARVRLPGSTSLRGTDPGLQSLRLVFAGSPGVGLMLNTFNES